MKQSAFVLSLLLANSATRQLKKPTNNQLFADGMSNDDDLVEKITYLADGSMRVGTPKAHSL